MCLRSTLNSWASITHPLSSTKKRKSSTFKGNFTWMLSRCISTLVRLYITFRATQFIDVIRLGNWKQSYEVAGRFLPPAELARIFNDEGRLLTSTGRYRDAEQLYLACGLLDSALSMYQSLKHYDSVIRLVSLHRREQLSKYHLDIAIQLQREGNRRSAENHFLAANNWKSVVAMYRDAGQWEEAFRAARSHGTRQEAADLALQWAVSVGPDIGGKLLVRNGMADECLSLACDKELVSEFSLLFKMKFY